MSWVKSSSPYARPTNQEYLVSDYTPACPRTTEIRLSCTNIFGENVFKLLMLCWFKLEIFMVNLLRTPDMGLHSWVASARQVFLVLFCLFVCLFLASGGNKVLKNVTTQWGMLMAISFCLGGWDRDWGSRRTVYESRKWNRRPLSTTLDASLFARRSLSVVQLLWTIPSWEHSSLSFHQI